MLEICLDVFTVLGGRGSDVIFFFNFFLVFIRYFLFLKYYPLTWFPLWKKKTLSTPNSN